MINLHFDDKVRMARRSVDLSLNITSASEDVGFFIQKNEKIPFLACFTRSRALEFDILYRRFGRMIDVETLMNVFMNGQQIVKVHVRRKYFLCGKGIILNENKEVLAMLTVTNKFYETFDRQAELDDTTIAANFTLVVNNKFVNDPALKVLFGAVKQVAESHGIDVRYTNNPKYGSFVEISLPAFRSLPEKRDFLSQLLDDFIENGLTQEVI